MIEFPTDYAYLYGQPDGRATIRSCNEDFKVVERLGFEPEGEGEHLFLYIRKTGENTDWVARLLAEYCQLNPRDVGYAGKKDRHAVTEQWFSVAVPPQRVIDWTQFGGESIEVLRTVRHPRKLRVGSLKGNRFGLRLREVSDPQELAARIELVRAGVPNYFGEQRFGIGGGNLQKGVELLRGERKERQRNKKSMYLSAVRSWCFNHQLSRRIESGHWHKLMPGDALMLDGSHSCFVTEEADEQIQSRLQEGDVHLTAAMWGRGEPVATGQARDWEKAQLAPWAEILERLEHIGLRQERRAMRLIPAAFEARMESEHQWWLEFDLPSGAFATSVLRELAQVGAQARGSSE
ncbi:MAG: tRNA pseudouridine(13) synthase TruD [Pontibacterium sp.]